MNKYVKYSVIFISIILSFIIIYYIIKIIIFFFNTKKSLNYAIFNTDKCGIRQCPAVENTEIRQYPPIIQTKVFNIDIVKYCSSLVYILEDASFKKINPVFPKELNLIKELYDNVNEPVYGCILQNVDTVWIIFRGSQTINEWQQDFIQQQSNYLNSKFSHLQTKSHSLQSYKNSSGISPSIHKGFIYIYEQFRQQILDALKNISNISNIIISGHSLGAAISTINALDLFQQNYKSIVVYNFASPRVGDPVFVEIFNNSEIKNFRIVNIADIIPTLPLSVFPNLVNPKIPILYEHCGQAITFTDNWLSIMNNHLMPVHMLALNNFKY